MGVSYICSIELGVSEGGSMGQLPANVADALRMAEDAEAHKRAAEITQAIALLHASELHGIGRRELDAALVDMAEEEKFSGQDLGMPGVGEFFCLEAAAVLGISPHEALRKLLTLQSLKYRLPSVWEAFCAGEILFWQAADLDSRVRKLSKDAALRVDHMIALEVRMRPWSGIRKKIDAWIMIADPQLAREERLLAAEQRRFCIGPIEAGHAEVHGVVEARDAADLEHVISTIASSLPTPALPQDHTGVELTGPRAVEYRRNVRRSMAVGELARQAYGQDALPTHTLVIHIDADDPALDPESDASGVATIDQFGALLSEDLPMLLTGSKVIVRPVLDIRKTAASDRHDPPPSMRFLIRQRNPVDVFPYGTLRAEQCDLDHTIPYDPDGPPGQTHPGNLGPLSRRTHRAKTFGGFRLEQPEPGVFLWTTPHGWRFKVSPEGTQKLSSPSAIREPVPEVPPDWPDPPPPPELPDEPPPMAQQVLPGLLHKMQFHAA